MNGTRLGSESVGSVTIHWRWDASGWMALSVDEVPGCVTQAKDIAEGIRRVADALELFLEKDDV
jgi:predicted RNase H-like HicB family nuclease